MASSGPTATAWVSGPSNGLDRIAASIPEVSKSTFRSSKINSTSTAG